MGELSVDPTIVYRLLTSLPIPWGPRSWSLPWRMALSPLLGPDYTDILLYPLNNLVYSSICGVGGTVVSLAAFNLSLGGHDGEIQ